jgi:uncharacterized protein (DUF58 family)
MMWWPYGTAMGWWMIVWMVVFWGGLIALIVWGITKLSWRNGSTPKHEPLAWLMNLTAPLAVRMIGDNPNRRTVENVVKSGLRVEQVTDLGVGIFKLIEARKK